MEYKNRQKKCDDITKEDGGKSEKIQISTQIELKTGKIYTYK